MIKRVVILQDEQLVVREIRAQHAARGGRAGAWRRPRRAAGRGGRRRRRRRCQAASPHRRPAVRRRTAKPRATTAADEPEPAEEGGGSLASVAKAASMKAERAAIEHTLRQVHWNRRKAAQILGVSYKTLLNKIKECGISRA